MKILLGLAAVALWCAQAQSGELSSIKTPPGEGAEYEVQLKTGAAKVMIYFVKPENSNEKAVEMYFEAKGMLSPIVMWQQFHLKKAGARLEVKKGFIHAPKFQTRILDKDYLKGFDGVQMNQFLISSEEDLKRHFVKKEKVTVKAGTVEASHYRMERNGQVVDFWIHHEAKPIGLVKLESKGDKVSQNYSMGLTRLVTGVGTKINPADAKPMDDTTRAFLPKPDSGSTSGLGMF